MSLKGFLFPHTKGRPQRVPVADQSALDIEATAPISADQEELDQLRQQLAQQAGEIAKLQIELAARDRRIAELPRFTADQLNAIMQHVMAELYVKGILAQEIEWDPEPGEDLAKLVGIESSAIALGFTAEQANGIILAAIELFRQQGWLTDAFDGWDPEGYEQLLGRLQTPALTGGLTDEQKGVLAKIWSSGLVGLFRELLEVAGVDPLPEWSECRRVVRELRLKPTLDKQAIGKAFQPVIAQILAEQASQADAPAPVDFTTPPSAPAATARRPVAVKPKQAEAASANNDEEF